MLGFLMDCFLASLSENAPGFPILPPSMVVVAMTRIGVVLWWMVPLPWSRGIGLLPRLRLLAMTIEGLLSHCERISL